MPRSAPRLSVRVRDLHGSPVRAMLEAAQAPGVISFGGGLPAPESFDDLALPSPPRGLMQYGPTEGEAELRRQVSKDLSATGLDCPAERILILSGSQQGVDLAAKLIVDPGTAVAVEAPAYLAALQVFRFFGARFQTLDRMAEDAGLHTAEGDAPALAYVVPTFQNPAGHCWSAEQRAALARACEAAGAILFEDDPYRDLAYDPCERTPACAWMKGGSWIYQGSFSKSFAPGLRLGFLAASQDLFEPLMRLKQAADLHANRLSQWMVLQYLRDPGRARRMSRVAGAYRDKRDRFATALARHWTDLADWSVPPGGLFFWATLRDGMDASDLLERSKREGVLFTPGEHFYAEAPRRDTLRLNFSHAEPDRAEHGLAVLARLMREG